MFAPSECETCFDQAPPTALAISFAITLIVGTFVSYFFQIYAFYKQKSSKGVSSFTLGFSMFSSLLTFVNFLILQWSRITCCTCLHIKECLLNNLTTFQLFSNVLSLMIVYSTFLYYFPMDTFGIFRLQRKKEFLIARVILVVVLILSALIGLLGAALHYWVKVSPYTLQVYGKSVGIVSAIVVVLQWSPQIFTTWTMGEAGSLSIVMLSLLLPGCLTTVFFQAVLDRSDFTTWVPYLITSFQISILIIMCIVFWCKKKQKFTYESYDLLLSENEGQNYIFEEDEGKIQKVKDSKSSYPNLLNLSNSGKQKPSLVDLDLPDSGDENS